MNNREIERKFTVEGLSYSDILSFLKQRYPTVVEDISSDLYWKAPKVDFVRLRENSKELTVKVTDKNTVVDRIEENVRVNVEDMEACSRLQTLLFGTPIKLIKKFAVFKTYSNPTGNMGADVIICVYMVQGDEKERLFLEVEAPYLFHVDHVVSYLSKKLNLTAVPHSLYQIFSEGL